MPIGHGVAAARSRVCLSWPCRQELEALDDRRHVGHLLVEAGSLDGAEDECRDGQRSPVAEVHQVEPHRLVRLDADARTLGWPSLAHDGDADDQPLR